MAGPSTPALRALVKAQVPHRVHRYRHDARIDAYGAEAVDVLTRELGVAATQIFKTLMVQTASGELAVAVLPAPATLALEATAGALGSPRAVMADAGKAQRASGYAVGGISPLGQRRRRPTVVDASMMCWDRVWCSAGRRGLEIELAPADLVRLTAARIAEIAVATAG